MVQGLIYSVALVILYMLMRHHLNIEHVMLLSLSDKFLAMTVDEKRKFYGHKNYTTLDKIDAWSKYYSQNEKQLKKSYPNGSYKLFL